MMFNFTSIGIIYNEYYCYYYVLQKFHEKMFGNVGMTKFLNV